MVDFILKYWLEFLFGIITAAIVGAIRSLTKKGKATAEGVKYLLMFKLRDEGERHIAEGHCPTQDKHEYEKVYNAYHALGGNDTVTELKNQVLKLPS